MPKNDNKKDIKQPKNRLQVVDLSPAIQTPPPPVKRAVRVKNAQQARRLLSRLLTDFQKGDRDTSEVRTLTYLLLSFIQVDKYAKEEADLLKFVNYFRKEIEIETNEFYQKLWTLIFKSIDEAEATKIEKQFLEIEKELNNTINTKTEQLKNNIKKNSVFKIDFQRLSDRKEKITIIKTLFEDLKNEDKEEIKKFISSN